MVASDVVGAVWGGLMADRIGRTAEIALMMAVSGLCALFIGFAYEVPLWLFLIVAIVWDVSVIGDSAQFSAMATKVSDPRYLGTALALQLRLGFALTVVSTRLPPVLASAIDWRWSFLMLVPGPLVGVVAMVVLRRPSEAHKIAHGLR